MTDTNGTVLNWNELTPEEERIIVHKEQEYPGTGELLNEKRNGTFICRRCNAPLYKSYDKFDSECGRPSFDDAIPGAVRRSLDEDGIRTEITCANCVGHLGHVFVGERITEKNTRHCVNSISMKFIPIETKGEELKAKDTQDVNTFGLGGPSPFDSATLRSGSGGQSLETIYFGGGCFWCIEAVFQQFRGVVDVKSGYMGGKRNYPSYEQVSTGVSGHIEVVRVMFDPQIIPLDILLDAFFVSHDPTSVDRQGHDTGEQYRSVVFYMNDNQKATIDTKVEQLNTEIYDNSIVTKVLPAETFWIAEGYHQDFYNQNSQKPYCQIVIDPKIKKVRDGFKEWLKE